MIPESGDRFPENIMVEQGDRASFDSIATALARQLAASPAVGMAVWQGY
jgi:hypothetical protein